MIDGSITLERMDENNREISQDFEGLEGAERFRVLNALDVNPRCLKVSARAAEYARRECQKIGEDAWRRAKPIRFCSMVTLAHEYGVSERAVRAWEAELVMAGIIFRRNPRSRRCGAVSGGGINFAPIAVQIDHFESQAKRVRLDIERHAELRSRHSRVVRHILRMLDRSVFFAGIAEIANDIRAQTETTRLERIYAATPLSELEAVCENLEALESTLITTLAAVENPIPELKYDDMTEENVRHTELQTDSPDPTDTSNQLVNKIRPRSYEREAYSSKRPHGRSIFEKSKKPVERPGQGPKVHPDGLNFDIIQPALCAASGEFVEAFGRAPGTQWQRMSYAATAVLRPLGIHPSAWKDAVEMIGEERAALCVLVTDAKHRLPDDHPKHVRSPGGYLRMMSKKDRVGALNVERSIFGLAKADVLATAS
jgi:replication initiation protein RepC